jgi:photosystem II stability/assembly factor-like uncharacterized protein
MATASRQMSRIFRVLCSAVIVVLCGLTIVMWPRQASRVPSSSAAHAKALNAFLQPTEENAARRLPHVDGLFLSVALQPGTNTIWAGGNTNLLVVSHDGGETWKQVKLDNVLQRRAGSSAASQTEPVTYMFFSIGFADRNNGWIIGEALNADDPVLLLTRDGGASWQLAPPFPEESSFFVLTDAAIAGDRIYAAAEDTLLVYTPKEGWKANETIAAMALHFFDDRNGVAIGHENETDAAGIFRTTDGARWQKVREISQVDDFMRFYFVDRQHGWVFGGSMVFHTEDGGLTWSEQKLPDGSAVFSAHFSTLKAGTLYGFGPPVSTRDGGATWKSVTGGTGTGVAAPNGGRRLVKAGLEGLKISDDSGTTWRTVVRGSVGITSLQMLGDRSRGWMALDAEHLLRTTDGGKTWTEQAGAPPSPFYLRFSDDGRGFVYTLFGKVFLTGDGGATWKPIPSPFPQDSVVQPVSPTTFLARRGEKSKISTDAGRTWSDLEMPGPVNAVMTFGVTHGIWLYPVRINGPLVADFTTLQWSEDGKIWTEIHIPIVTRKLFFLDEKQGWAAGMRGGIAFTVDGGKTWVKSNDTNTTAGLAHIQFTNVREGWAAGADGVLLKTTDGGRKWQRVSVGTMESDARWFRRSPAVRQVVNSDFTALAAVDASSVFVADAEGRLMLTRDGGATWTDQRAHRIRIAPWVFAAIGISLLLLLPLAIRPRPEIRRDAVLQMIVNDRPLAAGDADVLAFNEVARGVSNFLRNAGTRGPLAIAVEGPWGSGKSSLMTLLKTDLERYGYRPVWFNAWHHEKEDALLASLVETIRAQALPHPLSFRNLLFRARLLRLRLNKFWLLIVAGFLGVSYAAGVLYREMRNGSTYVADLFNGIVALGTGKLPEVSGGSAIFVTLAAIGALGTLISHLRTFGIAPEKLVDKGPSYREIAGFRHRFAVDFRQITEALDHTLTIFIDDLDRCTPAKMLEVLQVVNFLSTSGECFVILGMAQTHVLQGLSSTFDAVAGPAPQKKWWQRGSVEDHRITYARRYLEKLINIEVSVPQPTLAQMNALVTRSADEAVTRSLSPLSLRKAFAGGGIVAATVFIAFMLVAVFRVGSTGIETIADSAMQQITRPITHSTSDPPAAEPPKKQVHKTPQPRMPANLMGRTDRASILLQGTTAKPFHGPLYAFVGAILLLAVWGLLRRPDRETHDTDEFASALSHWTPLLFASGLTPRAVKRFVNRARYYAMHQRAHAGGTSIPDNAIVAFTALHETRPDWLHDPDFYRDFGAFIQKQPLDRGIKASLLRSDGQVVTRQHALRFFKMREGVRI